MTATPTDPTATPEVLGEALDRLRLQGALFFRSELSEAFLLESEPLAVAPFLHPGAERLLIFHVVAQGSCWVAGADGVRHWAHAGDVMVLPYGDRHVMGGYEDAELVSILSLIDPQPSDRIPVLRHGGDGPAVDMVCGYLYSEDPLFHPALGAFPAAFVVRLPPDGAIADWVRASIELTLDDTVRWSDDPNSLQRRLPELIVREVLRVHLATAPAANAGLLAAARDPVLAPALAAIHSAPERHWTVADIAAEAAVSRSVLDERFRSVLGRPPMRYVTDWRMHLACELLATTDESVGNISRLVGYDAEESFSRAFKRTYGVAPSVWRATA
jgi:AraC-like DNA-binding protein